MSAHAPRIPHRTIDIFWILFVAPAILTNIFPGGAVVAQLAVNELVVGSNPTRGAHMFINTIRSKKVLLSLLIVALLMMSTWGAASLGMTMQDGKMMENCPFMGVPAICNMSPLEHLSAWQHMFASTMPQFIMFALLLLMTVLLSRFFENFLEYKPPTARPVFYHWYEFAVFDPLKLAFARGLIHPKIL